MSVYTATVRRLAHVFPRALNRHYPPLEFEPILMQIDPRHLVVGDVFLFGGHENTVTWTNWEPINCRLEVHTNKGGKYLFTRDSDKVTTVL